MTVGMTGPTSLDQIRWSARTYRQDHPQLRACLRGGERARLSPQGT